MSLALVVISFIVFAYRLKQGLATKAEKILWLLWLIHAILVTVLACYVADELWVDTRYLKPADALVFGAAIWALLKMRCGKYLAYGALGVLVVYNGVMLTKHLIPGSRRNANLVACNWAEKLIREDWKTIDIPSNPKLFTICEYTTGGRPIIRPISKRMTYRLGARNGDLCFGVKEGTPDYIVEEDRRLDFDNVRKSDYLLMDELTLKKRHYSLFKRYRHKEFEDLGYAREHLVNLYPCRNEYTLEIDNTDKCERAFRSFFTEPLMNTIKPNEKYTYVLEILEKEGASPTFAIGDTEFGNSQLSSVRFKVDKPGTKFVTLTGRDITQDNGYPRYLERAYCYCEPGEKFRVTFRVSLFIGTEVNAENFHYVLPNEAMR